MRTALVGAIFLTMLACSGSPTDGGDPPTGNPPPNNPPNNPPAGNTVTIDGASLTFSPQAISVKQGERVTWESSGGGHTITPIGHNQWSRTVVSSSGEALNVTFNTVGSFPYHCELHSGMNGSVVVTAP